MQCLVLRIKTATESYLISIGLSLLLILERKDGHCLNLMSYLRCFVLMSLCCCFKYFCLSFRYEINFEILHCFSGTFNKEDKSILLNSSWTEPGEPYSRPHSCITPQQLTIYVT